MVEYRVTSINRVNGDYNEEYDYFTTRTEAMSYAERSCDSNTETVVDKITVDYKSGQESVETIAGFSKN